MNPKLILKKKKTGRPPHEKAHFVAETNKAKLFMLHIVGITTITVDMVEEVKTLCEMHGVEVIIKEQL